MLLSRFVVRELVALGSVALLPAWCVAANPPTGADVPAAGLRLLPENPRYFESKGLPLVLFMHKGGVQQMPYPDERSRLGIVQGSRHGNHFYMPLHSTWVRATPGELVKRLQDDAHWRGLRELARMAHEHDVILHLFFWSYKFNFGKQDWSGSDMVWPDPAHDGGLLFESEGLTRRDVHELTIRRALAATWDLPNVVYNVMCEYNVRHQRQDPDGAFHRWWAQRVRGRPPVRPAARASHFREARPGAAGARRRRFHHRRGRQRFLV